VNANYLEWDEMSIKVVAKNKRANFDYELLEKYEAGLVLTGTEIKSVRDNRVDLKRSYVQPRDGELWLVEAHIAEYKHGNRENHEPGRPRKLLLHRREIRNILDEMAQKSLTMVPVRLYLKDGLAKIEVALARGKKKYDKRADLAKRDANRQVERALRQKYDG
jgi:SsrA-binding protein